MGMVHSTVRRMTKPVAHGLDRLRRSALDMPPWSGAAVSAVSAAAAIPVRFDAHRIVRSFRSWTTL